MLVAYWPALAAGTIWNDEDYLTRPALRSFSGLRDIWFKIGATQQYYPVLHTFFWLEHRAWGDSALGYHLANIALHALAAILVGLLVRRLGLPGGRFAALLFALHPVCVESVAWISEQKNTLSAVFCFCAALCYLRLDDSGKDGERPKFPYLSGGYAFASFLFLVALLCKSVTATLPGALLVLAWWKRGRLDVRRDVMPLVPWLAMGAAVGLFSGWVEHTYIGATGPDFEIGWVTRVLVAGHAVWFYLAKLVWPHPLIFIYPRWSLDPAHPWDYAYPLAALAVLWFFWFIRGKARAPLAAALCFVGVLFPVLGFFDVYAFLFSYVADHFQYLASLAVIIPVAACWGRWRARGEPNGVIALGVAACVVLALGTLTWRQAGKYRNLETFYGAILADNPGAWMAHNNLGVALTEKGATEEALRHYEAAIALRPGYPEAHNNRGNALTSLGRPEEALKEFTEAVRLRPAYADGQNCLGNALARGGRLEEAREHLERAVALEPQSAESRYNLANVLAAEHRFPEALAQYDEALHFRPAFAECHNNMAVTLAQQERWTDAISHYRAALTLRPDYPEAENNLGVALYSAGHRDEAAAHFGAALRLRPNYPDARRNLEAVTAPGASP